MEAVNHTGSASWHIQDVLRVAVTLLATGSYLITLTYYYSWWVIVAVLPLALFGAAIVTFVLSVSADQWFFRLFWLGGGVTLAYMGATEAGRLGSIPMGLALILTAMCPFDELPETNAGKSAA